MQEYSTKLRKGKKLASCERTNNSAVQGRTGQLGRHQPSRYELYRGQFSSAERYGIGVRLKAQFACAGKISLHL